MISGSHLLCDHDVIDVHSRTRTSPPRQCFCGMLGIVKPMFFLLSIVVKGLRMNRRAQSFARTTVLQRVSCIRRCHARGHVQERGKLLGLYRTGYAILSNNIIGPLDALLLVPLMHARLLCVCVWGGGGVGVLGTISTKQGPGRRLHFLEDAATSSVFLNSSYILDSGH